MHTQGCYYLLPQLHVVPSQPQACLYKFGIQISSTSSQAHRVEQTAMYRGQSFMSVQPLSM